jgi:hypothetical protein
MSALSRLNAGGWVARRDVERHRYFEITAAGQAVPAGNCSTQIFGRRRAHAPPEPRDDANAGRPGITRWSAATRAAGGDGMPTTTRRCDSAPPSPADRAQLHGRVDTRTQPQVEGLVMTRLRRRSVPGCGSYPGRLDARRSWATGPTRESLSTRHNGDGVGVLPDRRILVAPPLRHQRHRHRAERADRLPKKLAQFEGGSPTGCPTGAP